MFVTNGVTLESCSTGTADCALTPATNIKAEENPTAATRRRLATLTDKFERSMITEFSPQKNEQQRSNDTLSEKVIPQNNSLPRYSRNPRRPLVFGAAMPCLNMWVSSSLKPTLPHLEKKKRNVSPGLAGGLISSRRRCWSARRRNRTFAEAGRSIPKSGRAISPSRRLEWPGGRPLPCAGADQLCRRAIARWFATPPPVSRPS